MTLDKRKVRIPNNGYICWSNENIARMAKLVLDGLSDIEIAQIMGTSPSGVKWARTKYTNLRRHKAMTHNGMGSSTSYYFIGTELKLCTR